MDTTDRKDLPPPRYVDGHAMQLAGLRERMHDNRPDGIPTMWQRFAPFIGTLAAQVGRDAYGVVLGGGPGQEMDYMCAVEVSGPDGLPGMLQHIQLAPQRYAVFRHAGHVSGVNASWTAIVNDWLPQAGVAALPAPWLERYGPEFDPRTGQGGVDLMVPVE